MLSGDSAGRTWSRLVILTDLMCCKFLICMCLRNIVFWPVAALYPVVSLWFHQGCPSECLSHWCLCTRGICGMLYSLFWLCEACIATTLHKSCQAKFDRKTKVHYFIREDNSTLSFFSKFQISGPIVEYEEVIMCSKKKKKEKDRGKDLLSC